MRCVAADSPTLIAKRLQTSAQRRGQVNRDRLVVMYCTQESQLVKRCQRRQLHDVKVTAVLLDERSPARQFPFEMKQSLRNTDRSVPIITSGALAIALGDPRARGEAMLFRE
jgi:hypothetical protein